MMRPSVGRVVHYYDVNTDVPSAAIVIQVNVKRGLDTITETQINDENTYDVMLHVLFTDGTLNLVAPFSDKAPVARHWTWPPRI